MKTILITGGVGFIGSNFVRYLLEKYSDYKVIVLDALLYAANPDNISDDMKRDPRFSFWYGNVRNGELVDTLVSQSDIVVHFAAETHVTRSIYDNFSFFETDVLGTQTVSNAVLKYSNSVERFIHISTSEVYGTARAPLIDEEHPLMPMSPYASAKVGADRLVYSYWATYDMPVIIVRPFNNYGARQHLEKVIPRFITSCLLNEPLTVHGDGKARRDWLYIEDTCDVLDRIIHCDLKLVRGGVINIGTGRDIDILSIANMIAEMMGKPKSMIKLIGDRPGQVFRHTASIEKVKRLLGWEPKVKFEDGLIRTSDWYRNNRSWWERMQWMRHVPIVTRDGKKEFH